MICRQFSQNGEQILADGWNKVHIVDTASDSTECAQQEGGIWNKIDNYGSFGAASSFEIICAPCRTGLERKFPSTTHGWFASGWTRAASALNTGTYLEKFSSSFAELTGHLRALSHCVLEDTRELQNYVGILRKILVRVSHSFFIILQPWRFDKNRRNGSSKFNWALP